MITILDKCTICGKPAIGSVLSTPWGGVNYINATYEPRCDEHGISTMLHIRSQADIDRIAALEAERDALRAQVNALPRPAILEFARLMEAKLTEKDALGYPDWRPYQEKDGVWRNLIEDHWNHLMEENGELNLAVFGHGEPFGDAYPIAVWYEAADVANMAMILADALKPLCDHDGRGRASNTNG